MAPRSFLNGRVALWAGDCLEAMQGFEANSFDSCVCDPPYHFASIVKRWSGDGPPPAEGVYRRSTTGFMGRTWDGGDIAFRPETWAEVLRVLKPGAHLLAFGAPKNYHRLAVAIEDGGFEIRDCLQWLFGQGFPKSHDAGNGWGTALKPAYEPIVLARKPLQGTVAANVLKHGTGAINIEACRVGTTRDVPSSPSKCKTPNGVYGDYGSGAEQELNPNLGRWPANVLLDGSDEVVEAFPEAGGGKPVPGNAHRDVYRDSWPGRSQVWHDDAGSAARFFYSAKADADDRIGSKHPTVKPLDLMQYLVRLITPPKGVVLDCFAGTGSTGEAAWREGFSAVLIEREEEYLSDIERRMGLCLAGPDERARESIKARMKDKPQDHGPLFGGQPERRGGGRQIYGVFADEQSAR